MLYRIAFFFIDLFARLPLRVLYIISDLLYPIVHYLVRYRLGVVRKNLRKAFPEKSEKELRYIERRFYRYFCDLTVETLKASRMSEEEFRRRVVFSGLELVQESIDEQKERDFTICYLGHFGNWEWLVSIPLHTGDVGMAQIYHPLRNKAFDSWMLANRSRFGGVNVPMKQTLRRMMQLRKEKTDMGYRGFLLGCIADQLPKRENVHHTISFLHQSTGVFTGSERIGQMFKASYLYVRMSRPRRGYYHVTFEPLEPQNAAPESEYPITDEYFRRFEADIRKAPHLWLWTHDRWKR